MIPIVNALKVSKVSFITLCRRRNFSQFQAGKNIREDQLIRALKENYKRSNSSEIEPSQYEHFKQELLCYENPIPEDDNPKIKVSKMS